jgi:hypothetical protein
MTIKTHDPESGNAVHLTTEEARSGATPHPLEACFAPASGRKTCL